MNDEDIIKVNRFLEIEITASKSIHIKGTYEGNGNFIVILLSEISDFIEALNEAKSIMLDKE